MSLLVIVSGPPGVGKSTLAKSLCERYSLVLLQKDGLKEAMFDTLGYSDREWSKKLGIASYRLMSLMLESILAAKGNVLIESNFKPQLDNPFFKEIQSRHSFDSIQVHCHADPEIVIARFRERVDAGARHPGHADQNNFEEHEKAIRNWDATPLDLDGEVLKADMNDFAAFDPSPIHQAIEKYLVSTPT